MRRSWFIICLLLLSPLFVIAQELLSPVAYSSVQAVKSISVCQLPFFDDFSNYIGVPNPVKWCNSQPFVNRGYGALPPTIGVVTLDAVDAEGVLHPGATTTTFSGDTLLSAQIRLDSSFYPVRKKLQPHDSIYLSFYYLPGGGSGDMWARNGDVPELGDSLILEFYNPVTDVWQFIWGTGGISVDTLIAHTGHAWQFVNVAIISPDYFNSKFQFRFRNYCSLDDMAKTGIVGNSDHWHLDYISLDYNRHWNDQYVFDVAFVNPAPSFLNDYMAIPARQYDTSMMCKNLNLTITNRYSDLMATHYNYYVYDQAGNEIFSYEGGNDNAPSYFPNGTYQTAPAHANPPVNSGLNKFKFPDTPTQQYYDIMHVIRGSVSNDDHPQNDTIRFRQEIQNYFAYDDGVAENGYGLTSTSSHVSLAYEFQLNEKDTLTAIDLYFNHTRNEETEFIPFYLCIWNDVEGHPGELLYKDTVRRYPIFSKLNTYVRYILEDEVVVNGKIYVGFEQTTNDFINLGFDRNNDVSLKIFYFTSGRWQQSILKGALMMRPYFGRKAIVGIEHPQPLLGRVYPNPVHSQLHFDVGPNIQVQLLNLHGQVLYQSIAPHTLDVSCYHSGIYFLRFIDTDTQQVSIKKLIIQ